VKLKEQALRLIELYCSQTQLYLKEKFVQLLKNVTNIFAIGCFGIPSDPPPPHFFLPGLSPEGYFAITAVRASEKKNIQAKKGGNVRINVILRRVRVTIVAVKK
jgi:hypothetical protein